MSKYILLIMLSVTLGACTLTQSDSVPEPTSSVSSEIPEAAKMMTGYGYPAVPLDQYNALSQTGASSQQ